MPPIKQAESHDSYKNYIFQSLIVFICICLVLLFYELWGGIVVASLGASSFILFVTPHADSSKARYLIGGYICGAAAGVSLGLLHSEIASLDFVGMRYVLICICAASAAVTTFLMIVTKSVHPPSAALALGLAADPKCVKTAAAAIAGIMILCAARRLLKKKLKNLV